jgi:hypothetical protein
MPRTKLCSKKHTAKIFAAKSVSYENRDISSGYLVQKACNLITDKTHDMKIPLGYLMHKMCSTKHEVILRLGQKRTQSSLTGKLHNGPKMRRKARSRRRVRQEKEAEFIHSQRTKRMRKNPDKNTVARANKQNKTTYTINCSCPSTGNLISAKESSGPKSI